MLDKIAKNGVKYTLGIELKEIKMLFMIEIERADDPKNEGLFGPFTSKKEIHMFAKKKKWTPLEDFSGKSVDKDNYYFFPPVKEGGRGGSVFAHVRTLKSPHVLSKCVAKDK